MKIRCAVINIAAQTHEKQVGIFNMTVIHISSWSLSDPFTTPSKLDFVEDKNRRAKPDDRSIPTEEDFALNRSKLLASKRAYYIN